MNINDIKNINIEFFDRIYISFFEISDDKYMEFIYKKLTSAFTRFLTFVPSETISGKKVLDAGCNDGYFFDFYLEKNPDFLCGCDLSFNSLLRGKTKKNGILRKLNKSINKLFGNCDLEKIPIRENFFDTILCFGTWHHFPQKENFLKECSRVLKSGGSLIISDPNKLQPLRRIADKVGVFLNELIEFELHLSIEESINLLEKHNFKIVNIHRYNFLSEGLAKFCDILIKKKSKLRYFFFFLFFCFYYLDRFLEKTVLKIFPNLSWSYILICQSLKE